MTILQRVANIQTLKLESMVPKTEQLAPTYTPAAEQSAPEALLAEKAS